MKRTIESLTPPANKQVMWLDISQEVKQLKAYINGEWVVVNDDTKNNEEIVNKVLEKIDKDFESYIKKEDADKAYAPKSDLEKKVDKVQGKGLSTEDFTSAEKAKLKGLPDNINVLDLMSYGISWRPNVADPILTRVGNMTYHRTLPIQNNMKGCIAQMKDGARIIYYLNENDWRFRTPQDARSYILKDQVINFDGNVHTLVNNVFETLQYEHQYVKINNIICEVTSINTKTKTATIVPEQVLVAGSYDVELGAVLNGYDGEVMVEVPEFWIKSWDTDTKKEVRISPSKIDDTWEHQPRALISPYHDTVLNTIPENMGYLSTLNINSAISVCNINEYCRGGNNSKDYDIYITSDKFRSMLGKARTGIRKDIMRTYYRNAGKEGLNYFQYKRIIYWLYIIEYANFNSQDSFNKQLTIDGFKQGGLDMGITNIDINDWNKYNEQSIITYNGYMNEFGNKTNIKKIVITLSTDKKITMYANKWHGIENLFGDVWTLLEGCFVKSNELIEDNIKYNKFYATDDQTLYNDNSKMKLIGISNSNSGYIKEFDLGNTAEIVPKTVGGDTTKYKCDRYTSDENLINSNIYVGGSAVTQFGAGIACLDSYGEENRSANYIAERSYCIL